jgi:hypothetical protein
MSEAWSEASAASGDEQVAACSGSSSREDSGRSKIRRRLSEPQACLKRQCIDLGNVLEDDPRSDCKQRRRRTCRAVSTAAGDAAALSAATDVGGTLGSERSRGRRRTHRLCRGLVDDGGNGVLLPRRIAFGAGLSFSDCEEQEGRGHGHSSQTEGAVQGSASSSSNRFQSFEHASNPEAIVRLSRRRQ